MPFVVRLWWAIHRLRERLADERGASFAEYLILLVLVAGAMMVSVPNLRDAMMQKLQSIVQQIQGMTTQ